MTPHEQEQMDYMAFVTAMRMLKDKNRDYFMQAAAYMLENDSFVIHGVEAVQELEKLIRVYQAVGITYSHPIPIRYHGRVPADMNYKP